MLFISNLFRTEQRMQTTERLDPEMDTKSLQSSSIESLGQVQKEGSNFFISPQTDWIRSIGLQIRVYTPPGNSAQPLFFSIYMPIIMFKTQLTRSIRLLYQSQIGGYSWLSFQFIYPFISSDRLLIYYTAQPYYLQSQIAHFCFMHLGSLFQSKFVSLSSFFSFFPFPQSPKLLFQIIIFPDLIKYNISKLLNLKLPNYSMDTHCKTQEPQRLQTMLENSQKVINNQNDEEIEKEREVYQSSSTQKKDCSFMSKQETAIFVSIYKQHRSKWSVYKQNLPKKQLNQIKNYFHNSIRNLALRLQKTEKRIQKFQRNIIDTASLHILLDLTYYFKVSINRVPAQYRNLIIFKANDYILHYCFENTSADEEELADLCKLIRTMKRLFKNLQMAKKNIKSDSYILKMTQFMHRIEQREINKQLQKQHKKEKVFQNSGLIKDEEELNEQFLGRKGQLDNRQTSSPQVAYDYNMFLSYQIWKWNMMMYQYNQNPYADYQQFYSTEQ